jgi:hypothetical protein
MRRSRPIIRNLRLDDHLVRAAQRTTEPKFQKTKPGQSLDEGRNLVVNASPPGWERAEWQTPAQGLSAM